MIADWSEQAERIDEQKTPRVRHIRSPHDPDVAWCGSRKRAEQKRYFWDQVPESNVCVICLSFPGAREYAMGAST